jgi:N-acetylglucosamine kinase-like BadF-type ATPase
VTDPRQGLLLGIDGGNTKSIALVATADGTIVGAGRSAGSSDIYAVPIDVAFGRLEEAAGAALAGAGATGTGVVAAGLSLAGADWPEDVELVREEVGTRWGGLTVANDGIGALRAAIPDGPGVVVVCGTGAATGARGADGRLWHSSFWQLPQGAHELGVAGIHAIVRAELGIGPATALTSDILGALGEPTVEAVLHRITGRATRTRREHGSIAPIVLDAAEAGDEVARAIALDHGSQLGRVASAAARRVGIEGTAFTLALAGGVLRHAGRTLRDALVGEVLATSPDAQVIQPALEPAAGALLLAFDAAGIRVDEAIGARLHATMPAAELFDTRGHRPLPT